MTELLNLAERCEQVSGPTDSNAGPCRALEIEIHDTVFGKDTYNCGGDGQRGIPQHLRSLDAAMTLVPEGMDFGCGSKDATGTAWAWAGQLNGPVYEIANATTAALALCAAALRAKAAAQ